MSKKNRQPAAPPAAEVQLMEMPGTRVLFWAVGVCPFCAARHYHPAGILSGRSYADPQEKLGEVPSPCGSGPYVLTLPPRPLKKKGKKGRRTDWNSDFDDE